MARSIKGSHGKTKFEAFIYLCLIMLMTKVFSNAKVCCQCYCDAAANYFRLKKQTAIKLVMANAFWPQPLFLPKPAASSGMLGRS